MNAKRRRDDVRLEPVLGAVNSPAPELELYANAPIKSRKTKATGKSDDSESRPEFEIKRPVIVLASLLLLISTIIFAVDQLFSPDSFEIEELSISAELTHLTPEAIRHEILPLIQNNYFAVDLKKVEQMVAGMDWVDQVSVRRQWPRSIHLRLTEQKPVAHWGKQGYLNNRAQSFNVEQAVEIEDLPYLHGPDGTQKQLLKQYREWKKVLAKKGLELESLLMTHRYAYEARVKISREQQKQLTETALMALFEEKKQPIPVIDWQRIKPFYLTLQLGKNDMVERLERFSGAFPDAFNDQVLKVATVDLRYPNGFAVRWNKDELPLDFLQFAVKVDQKI